MARNHLRPLFDRVVIKELEPDRMRQSGLVVPPGSHEPPPQHGIVLAVGQGVDWWEAAGVQMPVRPGDHVVFPASAGAWVEVDEERLLVCRVTELLGILERADEQLPVHRSTTRRRELIPSGSAEQRAQRPPDDVDGQRLRPDCTPSTSPVMNRLHSTPSRSVPL